VSSILEYILPGVAHLQNLHPLAVHFPLALLPVATAVYIVTWLTGRESWAWTGLFILIIGILSAALAVSLGLYAAPGVMIARSVRANLLEPHKRFMLTTFSLSVMATAWALIRPPFPIKGRLFFLILLVTVVITMTLGADYGGRMVYDYNAGGNACSQPIEFSQ
jgi:uncharacterized membrane protein